MHKLKCGNMSRPALFSRPFSRDISAVTFVDDLYNELKTVAARFGGSVFQQIANAIIPIRYIRKYQMCSANKSPLR